MATPTVLVWTAAVASLGLALAVGAGDTPLPAFSASGFSFSLWPNGTLAAFTVGNEELAAPSGLPFIQVALDNAWPQTAWLVPTTIDRTTAGELRGHFKLKGKGTATVSAQIQTVGQYMRLTVVSADEAIQQVKFGGLSLQLPRGSNGRCQNGFPMAPCDYLPHANDNNSAVLLLPLSPYVEASVDRTHPDTQVLSATAKRALPLVPPFPLNITGPSTSVLLWAGQLSNMSAALRDAESLFHMPSPRIAGTRAKDSPDMQQGYFLQGWNGVGPLLQATNASGVLYHTA
jgi:hypothetical protein